MTDPTELAERLLDAQVAFVLAELSGPSAAELVATEVGDLVDAVEDVPVTELIEPAAARATAHALLDAAGESPAVAAMVTTLVPLLRDLPASDDHRLGDVVDRTAVEDFVDVLVGSQTLREEVLRRLGQSPAVSDLALRFVSALVGDAVQQNRQRVERVPGAKSLLGMGDFAARQARGMAPKQLERMVGGAADKGAQAAMERVSRALVDTFDEEAVRAAAMEVWDLHADDTVAELRAYLTDGEVEELTASGHEVWLDLHGTPWFRRVVDTAIDAFFARYGERTVGEALTELGLDRERLTTEVERHAPRILEALHRDGRLEALVRRRIEPFFRSQAARDILDTAQDATT